MKQKIIKIASTFLLFFIIFIGYRFISLGSQSEMMGNQIKLGIINGKFLPCPNKPNCVSSFGVDEQKVDSLETSISLTNLIKLIEENFNNMKVESQQKDYVHITFKSSIFGFVDDLELLKADDVIHLKSASRVGHSDLGANKKRIDKIRSLIKN